LEREIRTTENRGSDIKIEVTEKQISARWKTQKFQTGGRDYKEEINNTV
jgi:hypothetical protein